MCLADTHELLKVPREIGKLAFGIGKQSPYITYSGSAVELGHYDPLVADGMSLIASLIHLHGSGIVDLQNVRDVLREKHSDTPTGTVARSIAESVQVLNKRLLELGVPTTHGFGWKDGKMIVTT